MDAAATGSGSVNTARKAGKRYSWGAERPGVIEKRVQLRKQQIDAEIANIYEAAEKHVARKIAEKRKLADQEALVAEHREDVKRRRAIKNVNSYVVPKGTFTDAEIAAMKEQYPGIDDEEAHLLLSKRASQVESLNTVSSDAVAEAVPAPPSASPDVSSQSAAGPRMSPAATHGARPAPAPKTNSFEKPKLAPVHIEASVTITAVSGEGQRNDLAECDWSDFDPDSWDEGQPYPEDQYREVLHPDGYRLLVARTDLEEPEERQVTPEIQAMRDRQRELRKAQTELIQANGKNRMLWSQAAIDEAKRLEQEKSQVDIQLCNALARL